MKSIQRSSFLMRTAPTSTATLGEKRELTKDAKFNEPKKWDTGSHMANFIAACRTRKHTELIAGIEAGFQSAGLCHMANISYRIAASWSSIRPRKSSSTTRKPDAVPETV